MGEDSAFFCEFQEAVAGVFGSDTGDSDSGDGSVFQDGF